MAEIVSRSDKRSLSPLSVSKSQALSTSQLLLNSKRDLKIRQKPSSSQLAIPSLNLSKSIIDNTIDCETQHLTSTKVDDILKTLEKKPKLTNTSKSSLRGIKRPGGPTPGIYLGIGGVKATLPAVSARDREVVGLLTERYDNDRTPSLNSRRTSQGKLKSARKHRLEKDFWDQLTPISEREMKNLLKLPEGYDLPAQTSEENQGRKTTREFPFKKSANTASATRRSESVKRSGLRTSKHPQPSQIGLRRSSKTLVKLSDISSNAIDTLPNITNNTTYTEPDDRSATNHTIIRSNMPSRTSNSKPRKPHTKDQIHRQYNQVLKQYFENRPYNNPEDVVKSEDWLLIGDTRRKNRAGIISAASLSPIGRMRNSDSTSSFASIKTTTRKRSPDKYNLLSGSSCLKTDGEKKLARRPVPTEERIKFLADEIERSKTVAKKAAQIDDMLDDVAKDNHLTPELQKKLNKYMEKRKHQQLLFGQQMETMEVKSGDPTVMRQTFGKKKFLDAQK